MLIWIMFCPHLWLPITAIYTAFMMGGWCKGDLEPVRLTPLSDTRIKVSDGGRIDTHPPSTHLTWTHANGTQENYWIAQEGPIGVHKGWPGYDWVELMDPWQEITRIRRCLDV